MIFVDKKKCQCGHPSSEHTAAGCATLINYHSGFCSCVSFNREATLSLGQKAFELTEELLESSETKLGE